MAADGVPGSRNQPHFLGPGAPATAVDLGLVSDYAAKVGNRKSDTNSARLALTGNDIWIGLEFYETDTGLTYISPDGAAWLRISAVYCSLVLSTAQTLPAATDTAILFDTELSDLSAMHDTSTNKSRVTVPIAGLYEVLASTYSGATSGTGTAHVKKNGASFLPGMWDRRVGDSSGTPLTVAGSASLAAGDYIEFFVTSSGASTAAGTLTADQSTAMTVRRLGPA